MQNDSLLKFSAAERDRIRRAVIGKPTDVIVHIGGFTIPLVPLTVERSRKFAELFDFFVVATQQAQNGKLTLESGELASKVESSVDLMRGALYDSAIASDLVDESDAGREVFEEWFEKLVVKDLLEQVGPSLIDANGLKALLGNLSTPPGGGATS